MTHIEFEHMVRNAIRAEVARFDSAVTMLSMQHLNVAVSYDHARSDGMWQVYCYVNSASLDFRGAILHDTMSRIITAVREQTNANYLPSLIAGPASSVPYSEDL